MWPLGRRKRASRVKTRGKGRARDLAYEALRSRDVEKMLAALREATDPLDRHFLFEGIVRETFSLRKSDHRMRDLCEKVGRQHLEEFPRIAEVLKEEIGYGTMPRVITFQCLGTLMTEWGAYQRAVEIYEMALAYGINDGTRGGFEAKITELHRMMRA